MANITALVLFNAQAFFYTEIITSVVPLSGEVKLG